jgi:hypothetical protein
MKIKQQTKYLDKKTTEKLYNIYRLATSILDSEREALWELIRESVKEHAVDQYSGNNFNTVTIKSPLSIQFSSEQLQDYQIHYKGVNKLQTAVSTYNTSGSTYNMTSNSYTYYQDDVKMISINDYKNISHSLDELDSYSLNSNSLKPAVSAKKTAANSNEIGMAKSLLDKSDVNELVKSKKLIKKVETENGKPYKVKTKMKDKFKGSYIPLNKEILKGFKI